MLAPSRVTTHSPFGTRAKAKGGQILALEEDPDGRTRAGAMLGVPLRLEATRRIVRGYPQTKALILITRSSSVGRRPKLEWGKPQHR